MNEKLQTTILEDVMYNADGTFRPFVGDHGNINGEIAEYRNTYMEAEKEYFSQLLVNENVRDYLKELLYNGNPEVMFEEATKIQSRLEFGNLETEQEKQQMQQMTPEEREQFHFAKLEYAEGIMCLLFAAIRDKALVLNQVLWWEERFSRIENSAKSTR